MKKRLLCIFCTALMLTASFTSALAFTAWESPRYIPSDEYKTPWTVEGNPYYTYYAPWLRQLHLMTATEAENNKAAGIVGGEACQQIRQLAISPLDSNIMYLCSDTSGVYKTTNGGKHWYNTTNNAAGHDAKGLLCDKFNKDTVYVYMRKVGVHRSRDGGYTWEQIVADTDRVQTAKYRSDTIVQDDEGNTYMCVGSGVWKLDRATDTVTNLTAAQYPELAALVEDNSAEFLDMAVSPDGQLIYACCIWTKSGTGVETGLYVSEDGGATWEIRKTGDDGSAYTDIRTIALDPRDSSGKTLYAGLRITASGAAATGDYALCKSTDGGKNWTSKNYTPTDLNNNKIRFYGLKFGPSTADGNYPLYLHLHDTNYPLRVSCNYHTASSPSFSQVYQSSHGMGAGTLREGYTGHLYQAFQPDMTTAGTNNIRVIYAASGIYEYTGEYYNKNYIIITSTGINKTGLTRISSGYSGASATDIAFDSAGRMFMAVTDVGTYVNDGSAYTASTYPTFTTGDGTKYGTRAIFDPNDDNHVIIYIGSTNGHGTYCGIKQSSDGGKTFAAFNEDAKLLYSESAEEGGSDEGSSEEDTGDAEGDSTDSDTSTGTSYPVANYGNAKVLCYDNEDKNTIYSSYHNSYDNGETWEPNEYFILDVHPENTKLQVAVSGSGADVVIHKTTDGGETWTQAAKPGFGGFTDVDFDLNNPDYLWITRNISGGSKAFVRLNLADGTVKDYTSKFPYKAFRKVEINPKDPNHMLVTSYPGRIAGNMKADFKLSESYDGGETWHTVPGLWGGDFNNIIFSPTTDEAFIIGLSGTFIYDYKKFNYYQGIEATYDGKTAKTTVRRVNENGENVNNGSFVIAPEDLFKPANKRFTGWDIDGKIYMPGDKIPISDLMND